jgi:hypothetical protein
LPHSEIPGSKPVRGSPRLIAAYHVLHRLSAPRHPPDTLKTLDRSHYPCPPLGRGHGPLPWYLLHQESHTGTRSHTTGLSSGHQDRGDPGFKTSLLQLYPQGCLTRPGPKVRHASAVKHDTHSIRTRLPETRPKPVPNTPIPNLAALADNQPDRVSLHDVKARSMRLPRKQHQATVRHKDQNGAKLVSASTLTGKRLNSLDHGSNQIGGA